MAERPIPPKIVRGRHLTSEDDAMQFNAWDDVEWGEEQTAEAEEKLGRDQSMLPAAVTAQYEELAAHYWDVFYQKNENKFFKERAYLHSEFSEILGTPEEQAAGVPRVMMEVGCGTGSSVFPLLRVSKSLFIHCFDFAKSAVDCLKANAEYDPARCNAFVHDISKADLPASIPPGSVDAATMIFVLSALRPEDQLDAVRRVYAALKPGGIVCLRDYGMYDLTQLRFKPGHKMGDQFYVRGDGTRVFFFTQDQLAELFTAAGFTVVENVYDRRLLVNRKRALKMYRVWLQGKFRKPL